MFYTATESINSPYVTRYNALIDRNHSQSEELTVFSMLILWDY